MRSVRAALTELERVREGLIDHESKQDPDPVQSPSVLPILDLPSQEVCIAMSWSGDYSVATSRAAEAGVDINLAYTIPLEGATDWYDVMYIPADAPHPDNAHLFLDFMLRPEVVARASNFTGYANANRNATKLVDPAITSDVAIYPDRETMARLHASKILTPKLERRRSRTWTKIKTGL